MSTFAFDLKSRQHKSTIPVIPYLEKETQVRLQIFLSIEKIDLGAHRPGRLPTPVRCAFAITTRERRCPKCLFVSYSSPGFIRLDQKFLILR